jgi:hypothetical protein
MTFIAKTGIGSRSPSFTPHTGKQLQSQRNEDSAPQESAVRIPLPGGLFALVDAADAERCLARKRNLRRWHGQGRVYAQTHWRESGRNRTETLHRFLLGCQRGDGQVVDHRNGDTLDNRRSNLRLTDRRGNATNVTSSKNQKAGGYKGVSWHPRAKKWQAAISAGPIKASGRRARVYLGLFVDPASAARAYDAAALRHYGEFAALNFPNRAA